MLCASVGAYGAPPGHNIIHCIDLNVVVAVVIAAAVVNMAKCNSMFVCDNRSTNDTSNETHFSCI